MRRILIVDDDEDLRRVLARGLSAFGYDVLLAGNGREAMAHLRDDPPDLVITDINMPEMDGIEVINALRGATPPIPILAMSGGGRLPKEMLLADASILGAVETIEKPFELATLLAAIERRLAEGDA